MLYICIRIWRREKREKETRFSLSPHLLIFYHVTCSHVLILFFLSLASKCHVHVREGRLRVSSVFSFLERRTGSLSTIRLESEGYKTRRNTARISFAIRKFRSLEKLPFTLTRHHQLVSRTSNPDPTFRNLLFNLSFEHREERTTRLEEAASTRFIMPTGTKHIVKHWIRTGNDRRSTKDKMMPDSRERIRYRFHTKKWGKRVDDRTFGTMPRLFAQKRK